MFSRNHKDMGRRLRIEVTEGNAGIILRNEFRAEVAEGLSDVRPVDADEAIAAVFGVLDRHVSEGQLAKVRNALPKGLKMVWDGAEARILAEAGA